MIQNNSYKIKFFRFNESNKAEIRQLFENINLKNLETGINFIKIENDTEADRLLLRSIINNNPNPFILYSDNTDVAELAWRSNAFYFINKNRVEWRNDVEKGLNKWIQYTLPEYKNKISFKSHKKIDFVLPSQITFILASGNYSVIYTDDGKEIVVTKQLGKLNETLKNWEFLERFGKSTVINLNKVKSIKDKTILFTNEKKLNFPKYSNSFVYLKNKLIWNI